MGYGRAELGSLVRSLRLRMADAGVEPHELAESGMGYANLAYIATVLTHLHAAARADLTGAAGGRTGGAPAPPVAIPCCSTT